MDGNPAGFDTKIMKNCGKIHLKRTKLDHLMNRLVVLVSFPKPLPWVGEHGGGERKGPNHRQKPGLSFCSLSFPPLQSMQPDSMVGLWTRELFLKMMI